ncbi:MAG: glycoside hydrolase family 2 protein [Planctomycetota bacterium]|nr:glycoside hydrolase family 2 protein [Planctomycetota bacterium]
MERTSRTIHDRWEVEPTSSVDGRPTLEPGRRLEARVPGVVHLDLEREGLVDSPDLGDAETREAWIGRTDWTWTRSMAASDLPSGVGDDHVVELVFDSIDTVGEVRLGGRVLGEVENQFIQHRFRVSASEIVDGSVLEVALRSPVRELERRVAQYGDRPVNADGDWGVYSLLRKAACSFGWDWGPKCPSLGLPGEVRIEAWREARISSVRPLVTECDEHRAVLVTRVAVAFEDASASVDPLLVDLVLAAPGGRRFKASAEVVRSSSGGEASATLEIDHPERWWPRDLGPAHLHDLEVTLRRGEGILDRAGRRVGLRTCELDTSPDEIGSRFTFRVNGRSVFCMGANWIPDGLHPGTASDERTHARIDQAIEAGFNMLRVWGGGVYESRAFHDRCDELGVLVWQDFMFACATYPEHESFQASVRDEVRHQVERLCAHPSIVLWCGGNENVLAWRNWGWRERMPEEQAWGRTYFTELLPEVVGALDPTRPFLPDSPWSGSVEADPNDPDRGDRHTWDLKLEEVRELVPRFVSEFGHQGPPARRSIEQAIGTEALSSERPEALEAFAGRQRGWGGDEQQYDRWLDDWFTPATDLDGRLWRMQLLQARAVGMTFDWARLNEPRCGGVLVWQLNDAWTGHSWSLIDAHGRPKPAFWEARRACRPHLLAFSVGEAGIELCGANSKNEAWSIDAIVRRVAIDGGDLAVDRCRCRVERGEATHLPLSSDLAVPEDPAREFLVAENADGLRAFWFYGKDAWISMPSPSLEIDVTPDGRGIEIHSASLVRDLHIDASRISPDASVDANLLTLLPGDRCRVGLRGVDDLQPADILRGLSGRGVVTSANECGAVR